MSTKNIVPRSGSQGKIGTNAKPWLEGHFDTAFVTTLNIDSLSGSIDFSGAVDSASFSNTAGTSTFSSYLTQPSASVSELTVPLESNMILFSDTFISGTFTVPTGSKVTFVDSDALAYTSSIVGSSISSSYSSFAENGFPYNGTAAVTGSIIPEGSGIHSLGSSDNRWANIFTSDLSLKNESGDWTIVEGEDDLYIYNNRKNKVYKFGLIEVDPNLAPRKSLERS